MEDTDREKVNNEDGIKENEKDSFILKREDPNFDTSSSDSDFEFAFTCKVCNKTFSGLKPLRQHEKSSKHLKKIRKKEAEKKLSQKLEEDFLESEEDQTLFATCQTCKKDFFGPESLEQHLKSRSHRKKMATSKLLKEIKDKDGHIDLEKLEQKRKENKSKKGIPLVVGKTSGQCDASKYSSKTAGVRGYSESAKSSGDSSDNETMTETQEFECLDCRKVFSGVEPWYQHVVSKVHEKIVKQKELVDKLELPGKSFPNESSTHQYLVQEDDVIFCRLCNVAFSGPESASMHLKSKKHTKNLELKKWKKALKGKREGNESSWKKKADLASSVEYSSEVRTKTHVQDTTEIKTDHHDDKHPNAEFSLHLDNMSIPEIKPFASMEKGAHLETPNSTEISFEEGREISSSNNSSEDEQKQFESSNVGSLEETAEHCKNNLKSFKETSI